VVSPVWLPLFESSADETAELVDTEGFSEPKPKVLTALASHTACQAVLHKDSHRLVAPEKLR
jgi:hypothetical protein